MPEPVGLPIAESSQVGEARRLATTLARTVGFDETGRGRVALVVTELATNLVKYGQAGELILIPVERVGVAGLEILAVDKGPGMAEIDRCMVDGYSTAGSPGNGLGAVERLGDAFDIVSSPGLGTAVLSRIWATPTPPESARPALAVGAVCLPMVGEEACGDAWGAIERDGVTSILVADGLGHGPQAAEASHVAVQVFHELAGAGPVEILQAVHAALKVTRGAVAAVAEVDPRGGAVRYAGIGNIATRILNEGESRSLVSHNGTLGHEVRKFQEFTHPWPPGALLVMHSDGLATQWGLDRYPGLSFCDPSLIAGLLYRDYKRGRDDVSVIVAREDSGGLDR